MPHQRFKRFDCQSAGGLTFSQTSPGLQCKSFENSEGKGELARHEQFLLFPQCFLPFQRTLPRFHELQTCPLQTLSVWESLKFVVWERNKSHLVTAFGQSLHACLVRLYKT